MNSLVSSPSPHTYMPSYQCADSYSAPCSAASNGVPHKLFDIKQANLLSFHILNPLFSDCGIFIPGTVKKLSLTDPCNSPIMKAYANNYVVKQWLILNIINFDSLALDPYSPVDCSLQNDTCRFTTVVDFLGLSIHTKSRYPGSRIRLVRVLSAGLYVLPHRVAGIYPP